jgi:hypothetical protein
MQEPLQKPIITMIFSTWDALPLFNYVVLHAFIHYEIVQYHDKGKVTIHSFGGCRL